MKILFGVQGTGNGHITRAIELIPYLQQYGEVDILVSGIQSDIQLPFKVKYTFHGLSFVFGKKGGVDIWRTYWKMKSLKLWKELKALPIKKYDIIISDFEPISSWAALRAGIPCIGLSNQIATMHPLAPLPPKADILGKMVLAHYAPITIGYGFHFKSLDQHIFTPIIRKAVRETISTNSGHYTVYLPSYSDEKIIKHLQKFEAIRWEVFSKHSKKSYRKKNINISPVQNEAFLESMASSEGVLCNAGFGTSSEALFLKKKLLVIPMKNQYEQHCNAAMLKEMGVPTIKKLNKKNREAIQNWIIGSEVVNVDYPDNAASVVAEIFQNHPEKSKVEKFPNKSLASLFKHI